MTSKNNVQRQPVPHRRVLRVKRTLDKFGRQITDNPPTTAPLNPNTRILEALANPENAALPESNAAVVMARSAFRSRRNPPGDPFAVRPVIARRPMLPYKIEEEEEEAKVDQFFVAAFKNISEDIAKISREFFGRNYHQGGDDEGAFFKDIGPLLTPTLRSLINFLVDGDAGGYHGKDGWKTILRNGQEREYLFRGILHKWIEENIFDKLLFGSTKEQEGLYTVQENTYISNNGYVRTRLRSETTVAVLSDHPIPRNFGQDVAKLSGVLTAELYPLHALLRPYYTQDYRGFADSVPDPRNPVPGTKLMRGPPNPPAYLDEPDKVAATLQESLRHLIEYAAYVHVVVRRSRNILQIVPAFRGTAFTPEDHITDSDGTAYYKATKAIIQTSDTYSAEKRYPSSFKPGIDESDPPCTETTFPVASKIALNPRTGENLGTYLQYVPYKPASSTLRAAGPILTTVAGAGFGMVGTYLAYTFDIDLPFGEGVWRGFAALPSNIVQGAAVGAAMGAAASIPLSKAVAVAGTAAGFMVGAVMGVVSEQGQIFYWNWTPDFDDLRDASWARKKALYSAALAGALAAGVVRWVKSGIVVPKNSQAFYPKDENLPLAIGVTSVGVPLCAEIAARLVDLGGIVLAENTPYLPVSPETVQSWWTPLRDFLVPLISSGSAAYLSTASDLNWARLIVSTGLGVVGVGATEIFARGGLTGPIDFSSRGYMSTLPASFIAATIATAAATSMRYRNEVTQPRVTDIPPSRIPHYRCLTRIGVTPGVRLYKPGDGSNRRNAQLNGQRIYEVQKATVLCHWGVENFYHYEGRMKIPLDAFLSQYEPRTTKPLSSLFSNLGSVFKSSTVGTGGNLIPPPPPPPTNTNEDSGYGDDEKGGDGGNERAQPAGTEEARRIQQLELENARLRAQQAGEQQPQAQLPTPPRSESRSPPRSPPRPQPRPQPRPRSPRAPPTTKPSWNLGARLKRKAISATHAIGDSYRVSKRFLVTKLRKIPTIIGDPRRTLKNILTTAAGVWLIALVLIAGYRTIPPAGEYLGNKLSSLKVPDFSGLGRAADDAAQRVSDSIHRVSDPVSSGIGSRVENAKDGFESGASKIRDQVESGKGFVKGGLKSGKDQVESGASKIRDQVESGKGFVKGGFKSGKDQVESGASKVKEQLQSGANKFKDSVKTGVKKEAKPLEPKKPTRVQEREEAQKAAAELERLAKEEKEAERAQKKKDQEAAAELERLAKEEKEAERAQKKKDQEAAAELKKLAKEEKEAERAEKKKDQENERLRRKAEAEAARKKKPKVTQFVNKEDDENTKKRMHEDQVDTVEPTAYDLSILNWVGYRGGDNAVPGEVPVPKRRRLNQQSSDPDLRRVGYRGGDNAFPNEKPIHNRPQLTPKRKLERQKLPPPSEEETETVVKRDGDIPVPVESVYLKRAKGRRAKKEGEERSWGRWAKSLVWGGEQQDHHPVKKRTTVERVVVDEEYE